MIVLISDVYSVFDIKVCSDSNSARPLDDLST